jgi:FkbM family methyltransferase
MINKQLLHDYIQDPTNPLKCYNLAVNYYMLKHYGEAVSFFLRAAEHSEGDLRFNSMLHVAFCYRELKGRNYTLNSIYKSLVAQYPERPEPYYHLAKLCETENANVDGYMWANLALKYIKNVNTKFEHLELIGEAEILFLKSHFAWLMDKPVEARFTLNRILKEYRYQLNEEQLAYLGGRLTAFGMAPEWKTIQKYDNKDNKWRWIYHFDGIDQIDHNHSQALQDMFALYCHNGKRNGTYLEVGAAYPYYTNNSALLEEFGWRGVGLELNDDMIKNYNEFRKNKSLKINALEADYDALLTEYCGTTDIDYLQLDIKTSSDTYEALKKIPFDKYRFAVITYEHDDYVDTTQSFKQKARELLWSKGYALAVPDVSPIDGYSFEDWWIHPDLIDITRVWSMNRIADLNWGDSNEWDRATIYREVHIEKVYDHWRSVEDGDVVVDLGGNVGAFSVMALRKKLKKLHVVEASSKFMDLAIQNTQRKNERDVDISYHNNAITSSSDKVHSFAKDDEIHCKTFSDFVRENDLSFINFLKVDIEGGEYDIFTSENVDYLKNNVMFIAAEFHLNYEGNREQWKHFRDHILPEFSSYKIISCTTQNIVPGEMIDLENYLSSDEFVDSYGCQFMVYINNDSSYV